MQNTTVQAIKTKYSSLEPGSMSGHAASGLPPKPEPSGGVESLGFPKPPGSLGSPSKPVWPNSPSPSLLPIGRWTALGYADRGVDESP